MHNLTLASVFTGYGLAESGARAAGFEPCSALEIEPRLAEVYRANHGGHVHVGDVTQYPFWKLEKGDVFWASPSCKNASQANTGGSETQGDRDRATIVRNHSPGPVPSYWKTLECTEILTPSVSSCAPWPIAGMPKISGA